MRAHQHIRPQRVWSPTTARALRVETCLHIGAVRCPVCTGSIVVRHDRRGERGFDFEFVCNKCSASGVVRCGVAAGV